MSAFASKADTVRYRYALPTKVPTCDDSLDMGLLTETGTWSSRRYKIVPVGKFVRFYFVLTGVNPVVVIKSSLMIGRPKDDG